MSKKTPLKHLCIKSVAGFRFTKIIVASVMVFVFLAESSYATTLMRKSLKSLTTEHKTIVIAKALNANSHWNSDGSMIVTDITLRTEQNLKGQSGNSELTVTLLGGKVGDITTLIIDGATLIPGNSYLLFLNKKQLGSGNSVLTVSEHSQGAFDIIRKKGAQQRAISQASKVNLVADAKGLSKAPGGINGFNLDEAIKLISEMTKGPKQ